MEKYFNRMEEHAKRISDMMARAGVSSYASQGSQVSGGGVSYAPNPKGGHAQPVNTMYTPPSPASQAHRAAHQGQYNLMTPSGLEMYYQNVMEQAAPVLAMFQQQTKQMTSGVRTKSSQSRFHSGVSQQEIEKWFTSLSNKNMPQHVRSRYSAAMGEFVGTGDISAIQTFMQDFGSEYGAPTATYSGPSGVSRLYHHFRSSANGRSFRGVVSSGLKGVASGVIGDSVASGAMGEGTGIVLGDLLGGPLAGVAAGITGATLGYLKHGFNQWMETAVPVSQLAHSLGDAAQGVESFRNAIVRAGADAGMTGAQSTQIATLLAGSYNGNTRKSIPNLVHLSGAYGLNFGMSGQQIAQILSASALAGVTNGGGSQYTPGSYLGMLGNMVIATGMQGRQGQLFTGLADVYNTLAGINPVIANQPGVAAQYTALNKTGIQGLQGANGAALISSMDKAFASPSGIQQAIAMSAILQASGGKITDPFQMLSIMEQGTAAKIGDTTLGAAYLNRVKTLTNNPYLQGALMPGLDINQGMAMIKSGALLATKAPSSNYSSTTTRTTSDILQQAMANFNAQSANLASGGAKILANMSKTLGYADSTISMTNSYLNQLAQEAQQAEAQQKKMLENLRKNDPYANGRFGPYTGGSSPYGAGVPTPGSVISNFFSYVGSGISNWWSSITGGNNQQEVFNFLKSKGLSDAAVAGIMGNLEQESSLNPNATNSSSGAYGIAQWLGSRLTGLKQYASIHHTSASSLNTQLNYLWRELKSGQEGSIAVLNSMPDAGAAAQYFEQSYERAGVGANIANRINYANQFYNEFTVNISAQSTANLGRAVALGLHNIGGPIG